MQKHVAPSRWSVVLDFIGVEILPRNYIEKALSTIGAFIGILVVYAISLSMMDQNSAILIVPSMGATAMLLFSLPHAAVSQPWPTVAGQVLCALVGVFVARNIADPLIAAPMAVALCTILSFFGRCVHPPGAATAFTVVFATQGIHDMGYSFVLAPVALNASVLVIMAIAFNAPFDWRRYPSGWHKKSRVDLDIKQPDCAISHDDFVRAVRELDTFVDISEDDLLKLHELISSSQAARRR